MVRGLLTRGDGRCGCSAMTKAVRLSDGCRSDRSTDVPRTPKRSKWAFTSILCPAAGHRPPVAEPRDRACARPRHLDAAGIHVRAQRPERRTVQRRRLQRAGAIYPGVARLDGVRRDLLILVERCDCATRPGTAAGRSFCSRSHAAGPADPADVHALIAGLADYEGLTGICVATQDDLARALVRRAPLCRGIDCKT